MTIPDMGSGKRKADTTVDELLDDSILEEDIRDNDIDVDAFMTQAPKVSASRKRIKALNAAKMTQGPEEAVDDKVSGVIKRVVLKNFMCHSNFELELGPRLNFIIGHNGSGKSSILTAISVCLGAKATETNRGSSLRDLIKEGTNVSEITVVLCNEGDEAYEHEVYGDEIVVQRTLRREASSFPYVLKSETGKKISGKKSDLDSILDYFNIAVSNPMSFLSQDMARSFLTASSDEQKYTFFMKGTMMQEMVENFKQAKEKITGITSRILKMKDDIVELKAESAQARKLHERLIDSNDLRVRQRIYHGKYFWMEHENASKVCEEINTHVAEHEQVITGYNERIAEETENIDRFEAERERAQQKYDHLIEEVNQIKIAHTEKKTQTKDKMRQAESVATKINDAKHEILMYEESLRSLTKQISREEEELRLKSGGSKTALEEQLTGLKQQLTDLHAQGHTLKEQLNEISLENKDEFERLSAAVNDKREEINYIQRQINEARQQRPPDPLASYPKEFRAVVTEMKRTRFREPVLGPVGCHVFIKPGFEKYRGLIEAHLGLQFNSFIAQNESDRRLLYGICKRHRLNCPVYSRKLDRFDYSHGLLHDDYQTILDALEFDREEAKYALIDASEIERVVLCDDRRQGQEILENNIRDVRHNVRTVLSLGGATSGFELRKQRYGGFLSNPVYYDLHSQPKLNLRTGVMDTSSLEAELRRHHQEMQSIEQDKQSLKNHINNQERGLKDQIRKIETDARRVDAQIYQLDKKLTEYSSTAKLDALIEERLDTMRQKAAYEQALPAMEEELVVLSTAAGKLNSELEKIKEQARETTGLSDRARAKVVEYESQIQLAINRREHHIKSKNKRIQEVQGMRENLPTWEAKVIETKAEGQRFCTYEEAQKVKVKDTEELKRKIGEITRKVEAANELLGKSPEQIVHEDMVARDKYSRGMAQFTAAKKTKNMLDQSLHRRLKAFRTSRDHTLVAADIDFKDSLQFRNFSGNLEFDNQKGKLKMLVSTKNDKKPRHVDSLSGGEKSFSQIALLLATWKPMKSRIKGLDEFDVFMDQINRKIGMRLMLSKLSQQVKAQTIFITPQDIGQIADLDPNFVRIHRVKDPRS